MHNYIKADLNRIFRRVPRNVLMAICFAVFCLAVFIYVSVTSVLADPAFAELGLGVEVESAVFRAIRTISGYAIGMFGLFELIYVFSDDFKAKTAQIAIGVGVSRGKVVFCKLVDMLVLLAVDMAVLLGLSMLMSVVMGSAMTGAQIAELASLLAAGMLLNNIAYSCLVFILLFATQSMTLGVLGFLALHFHVVSNALGLAEHAKPLRNLDISGHTLTTFLNQIGDMVKGAALEVKPIIGVAVYVVIALLITTIIYRKKELEF